MHSVNELLDGCLWHVTGNVAGLSNHCCLLHRHPFNLSLFFSRCHFQMAVQTRLSLSDPTVFKKHLPSLLQTYLFTTTSPPITVSSHIFFLPFKFSLHFQVFVSFCFSCVVILCISCCFALRDSESYLAASYCSYQGHTVPIIKELKSVSVKYKLDSKGHNLPLADVNIILKCKPDLI